MAAVAQLDGVAIALLQPVPSLSSSHGSGALGGSGGDAGGKGGGGGAGGGLGGGGALGEPGMQMHCRCSGSQSTVLLKFVLKKS